MRKEAKRNREERKARLLMIQGTSSGAGKSTIVTGLCRFFADKGYSVVPFKAQNMSSNSYVANSGTSARSGIMALVQAVQAVASRKDPDTRMNPILLKPLGNYRSRVFVNGRLHSDMYAKEYYRSFVVQHGFPIVLEALQSLRKENDLVIIEGAGSPAEINITKYDIANMLLAEKVRAPVILVADIERGGCFASIVGTMRLLRPAHRRLVKGFLINKFRGDNSLLTPAIESIQRMTRRQVLGIIPKIEFDLPQEDSLDNRPGSSLEFNKDPTNLLGADSWTMQIDLVAKAIEKWINTKRIEKLVC